jgi:hypothetical protein
MWFDKSKARKNADEVLEWAKKKGLKVEKASTSKKSK